ncbi:uncharacterized protein LOC131977960 [Centropristis striata]|uniref:uncharacterized protein LOC131977960 n=1 Tax=Centropristis striata TaxID=184440 RepID=UPI0027E0586B|nr:uncharacterized protein LOC131977960 [Centropristis striata]
MAAAAAAVNRPPPAHPAPNGGNLHTHTHGSGPTSEHQDPGLHSTNPDPGPPPHPSHPHPHVPVRPVYYVHAPPPPFLHYQWPMPFPYNPFAGFPGMGYGMVMPPFPPPPYMEAPAYIVPHPHIQPVDYRRLLHPQVHPPSAPYQNPNQTRRIRPPHTVRVRETVNSEVQTEPPQRVVGGYGDGSPLIGSDSGHGTASSSPSSSSSSQKEGSTEVENHTLPRSNAKDVRVGSPCTSGTVKHGFNIIRPTGTKTVQSCIRATLESEKSRKDSVGQENVPPCRNGHCNMWSVSSQDSMVPVCSSSQQEEEVVKERRVSVPDILMSWGGGTQQETMMKLTEKLPQNDHQVPSYETEVEHEKFVTESPTGTRNGPVVPEDANGDVQGALNPKDSATLFKVLKLREALADLTECRRENEHVGLVGSVRHCLSYKDEVLHSPNKSHTVPDNEQDNVNETNPHEDSTEYTEIIPNPMFLNGSQMKKQLNESIWSVESLPIFMSTKEHQLHNSVFEPEIIIETTEEVENGNETYPHEDTTEIVPYPMSLNSSQKKKKMNESVWSVESLPIFIPTKAWFLQNSTFEPEVIVEMMEEVENGGSPTENDNRIVKSCKEKKTRRCSSSDSGPTSNRCLVFSTPTGKQSSPKKPECQSESEASEMRTPKHGQSMAPSEKDLLASPTPLSRRILLSTSTEEDVAENRSSEPEAVQSPNQASLIVNEQKGKSPCLPEQEKTLSLNSAPGEEVSSPSRLTIDMEAVDGACREEVSQLIKGQLGVPMADQTMEVSPLRGNLVDCGVQCTELEETCVCKEMKSSMGPNRRHHFKYPDIRKGNNGQAEGFGMRGQKNQRRNGHWRNRGQEKHGSQQQEAYTGYCGKPGKPQGGNGRNVRY